ncbi:MAG: hypothetical protein EDM75_11875 [Chlorobiota bacterium]|nr:MAG: hypothetical protein EDM75_11875 [Chlorobiota bacterium]
MKKILILVVFALNCPAFAQWLPVNLMLSGAPIYQGKLYTDHRIAILSTGTDVFYKSFDHGRTWAFEKLPLNDVFNSFAAAASGEMLAMRRMSEYMISSNVAATWRRVYTSLSSGEVVTDIEGGRQNFFFIASAKNLYRKTGGFDWLVKLTLPLATNENINKVETFKDSGVLLIATSTGKVYKSQDDGASWSEVINVGSNITILEVHDTNTVTFCVPGTSQSKIYTSSDRGTSWDSIPVPFNISELHMASKTKGMAKSSTNQVYITNDGMRNWTLNTSIKALHMGFTRDGKGLIITPESFVYLTSDYGENWELNSELNTNTITGIEVLADNSAYAFTPFGNLYRSGDYGMTWQLIRDSLPGTLTRLTRDSDTSFLMYDPGGTVLRYSAATGAISNISATFPLYDQTIYSYGDSLFAIKNMSRIHFSDDRGLTWTTRTIPDSASVNFFFAADSFFYIAANNGTIYESSNRGATWSSRRLSTVANDKILFIYRNGLRLWACSNLRGMYFSPDGGIHWISINYKNTYRAFYAHKNLWIMQVASDEIVQTTDEGRTWQRTLHYPSELLIKSLKVNPPHFGLMLSSQGRIFLMHNGGLPVELTSFNAEVVPTGVHLSWETATETNNYGFYLQRRNSGVWSDLAFIPGKGTTPRKTSYSWLDDLKPQKGDTNFYRLKQVDLSGEFSYSKEVAVGFSPYTLELDQNFPNPFTLNGEEGGNRTQIRFRLPEDGHGSLRVFDARGRLVEELFSGNLSAGEHSFPFPSPGVSPASGVYFYELRFNGSVKRGKMLLLR